MCHPNLTGHDKSNFPIGQGLWINIIKQGEEGYLTERLSGRASKPTPRPAIVVRCHTFTKHVPGVWQGLANQGIVVDLSWPINSLAKFPLSFGPPKMGSSLENHLNLIQVSRCSGYQPTSFHHFDVWLSLAPPVGIKT